MKILMIETLRPEKQNFVLHRDDIGKQYIFIHFLTPVTAILRGEEVDIKPGGCVFFGINSMQHFSSELCELLHDWFHADEECGNLMSKYGIECEKVYYPGNSDKITRLIAETELEYIKQKEFYQNAAESAVEQIMILLARSLNPKDTPDIDFLQKEAFIQARSKIHMDLRRSWSTEEMAQLVNLSPSRFYYLYKKMFGISPHSDLIRKRVQKAQTLLIRGCFTVDEVAKMCGYGNTYHFIRQFKSITGITPGSLK